MLYKDGDEARVKATRRNRLIIAGAIVACACLAAVPGFTYRVMLMAYIPVVILLCAAYYYFMIKVVPWLKYAKFMKDMREGLTREATVKIMSRDRDTVLRDGVMFYPVLARVGEGEEDERQYYWDADKGYPEALIEGQTYCIRSFGNSVVEVTQA